MAPDEITLKLRDVRAASGLSLSKVAKVTGDAGQVYLDSNTSKVLDEAEKLAQKAGDSFVPVERILTALAVVPSKAKEALDAGRRCRYGDEAERRDQRSAQRAHRR